MTVLVLKSIKTQDIKNLLSFLDKKKILWKLLKLNFNISNIIDNYVLNMHLTRYCTGIIIFYNYVMRKYYIREKGIQNYFYKDL